MRRDPTELRSLAVEPRDLRDCLAGLEATCVVRLFAEFEAALRESWMRIRRLSHLPANSVNTLIGNVAGRQNIPATDVRQAHHLRRYRNSLVHIGLHCKPLTFQECRSGMGRFLRWLPARF